MTNDGIPVEEISAPVPASPAAQGLRVVLDLLLQDMALEPVEPAVLPWREPILVLRSADMERFRAVLRQIVTYCPAPLLHVLSHARDEQTIRDAIREIVHCDVTFHGYPTPGRYRLNGVPVAMLERLRSAGFGTLVYLDPGTSADLFGEVEAIFAGIQATGMVSVRVDGTWSRAPDARLRRQAESAFLGLIEWYQRKLDPALPVATA
jgi:hypothetical protein